jgi:hypothetical protein
LAGGAVIVEYEQNGNDRAVKKSNKQQFIKQIHESKQKEKYGRRMDIINIGKDGQATLAQGIQERKQDACKNTGFAGR